MISDVVYINNRSISIRHTQLIKRALIIIGVLRPPLSRRSSMAFALILRCDGDAD